MQCSLAFDRVIRELLVAYAGKGGVWEVADDGFISHEHDPILAALSDLTVWEQLPANCAAGPDLKRSGYPIYQIPPSHITPRMAKVWAWKLAQDADCLVQAQSAVGGIVILANGGRDAVEFAIRLNLNLLEHLQRAAADRLELLEIRFGQRDPGGNWLDPDTKIVWLTIC